MAQHALDCDGAHPWPECCGRGPIESGVQAEIRGLAAEARPGLAAVALAPILDDPKSVSQKAVAAKVLTALAGKLRAASARGRRGGLGLVRSMTETRRAHQSMVTLTGASWAGRPATSECMITISQRIAGDDHHFCTFLRLVARAQVTGP